MFEVLLPVGDTLVKGTFTGEYKVRQQIKGMKDLEV